MTQTQISSNIAAASALEDEILQENLVDQSEENVISDEVDPDGDIVMGPIYSPNTLTGHNVDNYQVSKPTGCRSDILSICNPNNEDINIRLGCASELFDNNMNNVQIPSTVKNATCELNLKHLQL